MQRVQKAIRGEIQKGIDQLGPRPAQQTGYHDHPDRITLEHEYDKDGLITKTRGHLHQPGSKFTLEGYPADNLPSVAKDSIKNEGQVIYSTDWITHE